MKLPVQLRRQPHRCSASPNEWAYLPPSQLDLRPVLESAVTLPFPEGANLPRGASVSAVLVLYVNADRMVDRIEFAQSALAEVFAHTAVESFPPVHLRPGMKDGRPVSRDRRRSLQSGRCPPIQRQTFGDIVSKEIDYGLIALHRAGYGGYHPEMDHAAKPKRHGGHGRKRG